MHMLRNNALVIEDEKKTKRRVSRNINKSADEIIEYRYRKRNRFYMKKMLPKQEKIS